MIRKMYGLTYDRRGDTPPRPPQISLIALFAAICLVIFCSPPELRPDTEADVAEKYRQAAPLFDNGQKLFLDGDMAGAEQNLRQCLELCPEHADAHYVLARILQEKDAAAQALEHSGLAVDNTKNLYNLLLLAQQESFARINDEIIHIRQQIANTSDPGEKEKWQKQTGELTLRLQEAKPSLDDLQLRHGDLRGVLLYQAGDYNGAVEQFQNVAAINPRYRDVLKNLAAALYMAHDFDQALAVLKRSEEEFGVSYPELKTSVEAGLNASGNIRSLLIHLLAKPLTAVNADQTADPMSAFRSVYAKFSRRPELLTPKLIYTLNENYHRYNVLMDFIEKIPIRKPETVELLLKTARQLEKLENKERELLTAMFQAMLELYAQAARYSETSFDYDLLVTDLCRLPLTAPAYYEGLFFIFKHRLGLNPERPDMTDFVLSGVKARPVSLNDVDFYFNIRPSYEEMIRDILESQNIASLDKLARLNRLMENMLLSAQDTLRISSLAGQLSEFIFQLPHADISAEAPKDIVERVKSYEKENLYEGVNILVRESSQGIREDRLKGFLLVLKRDYLVYHLKDYLVGMAYAVNGRSSRLKVFLNPNFVRLHDFSRTDNRGPWRYCGPPPASDTFAEYSLSGGLSRLSLSFAVKWSEYLFSQTFVYNPAHAQALLANILDMFPLPGVEHSVAYNALLTDYGIELMIRCREDKEMKEQVRKALSNMLAGYHYRSAMDYLDGKTSEHRLFFSEMHRLGEYFLSNSLYLGRCGLKSKLEPFTRPPLSEALKKENDRFGGIFYHTFGNLTARRFNFMPQELSMMTQDGWMGGEMINEFKLRLAWHMHQKNIPPVLMGSILQSYMVKTAPRAFSQSHTRDYNAAYFIFEIFNNAIMNGAIKDLQKQGCLRLK